MKEKEKYFTIKTNLSNFCPDPAPQKVLDDKLEVEERLQQEHRKRIENYWFVLKVHVFKKAVT